MAEYKHGFVDDNPYIVYSENAEQSYVPGVLETLAEGATISDAGKVFGIDESGNVALIELGD